MNIDRPQLQKIRETLNEEFGGKCAYCKSAIGVTSQSMVENFYPKSKYPDKAYQLDNLLLSCQICDFSKADKFPTNENGEPLLLNPRFDDYDEHIKIDKTGLATHLTEKGAVTINLLNLNRPALVESRKLKELEKELFENFKKVNKDYFSNFEENIKLIRSLTQVTSIASVNISQYLKNMLFANVITCIEAYLSDALKVIVISKKEYLRKFVETFKDFKLEKFELQDVFNQYDNIEDKATKAILDVIYHDLPKVKGMYQDTLGITFPNIGVIMKAVSKRHDFVHRNGKTKDGKKHKIEVSDIEALCVEAENFIKDINNQIEALTKQ
jgi:uncharacterized protein (TIGR02646 family)